MILVYWEVVSLADVFLHTGLLLGKLSVILTFYKESESKSKSENESVLLRQMKTKNGLPSCRQPAFRGLCLTPSLAYCGGGVLGDSTAKKKSYVL